MHRRLIPLLLLVLLLLGGLVACRKDVPQTTVPTTSEATLVPGLDTTPDDFVGFDDPTGATESATQPTEPATEPSVVQPTTPPPTTEPATQATAGTTGDLTEEEQLLADATAYVSYMKMDAQQQYEIFKSFDSIEAFNAWFTQVENAYKTLCTNPDYDGGDLVLPE